MPRPRKAIPDLYWLNQKKTWCVNLGGKRHLLGSDKEAADRRRLELLKEEERRKEVAAGGDGDGDEPDELRDPLSVPSNRLKVAEVVVAYLKRMRPGMDQRHVARVHKAAGLLIEKHGEVPACQLTPLHVVDLRAELVKESGYARRYINHLISAIKTIWKWAVENTLVNGERARAVLGIRALGAGEGGVETAPRLPADPDAVENTIPHLTPLLGDCVRLLRITGARPAELLGMRRCDVSTGEGERLEPLPGWFVTGGKVGRKVVWLFVPSKHKTTRKGKVRVIALGKSAQQILGPLLVGLAPTDLVFTPKRAEVIRLAEMRAARKTPVQPSQVSRKKFRPLRGPGERYGTDALDKAIQRACRHAGVDPWTPYQLRHGRAAAVADMHGEELAGDVLGHAEGSSVTRTYTRTKLARLMELAAREG